MPDTSADTTVVTLEQSSVASTPTQPSRVTTAGPTSTSAATLVVEPPSVSPMPLGAMPDGLVPAPVPQFATGHLVGLTDPVAGSPAYATVVLRSPDGSISSVRAPRPVVEVSPTAVPGVALLSFDGFELGMPFGLLDATTGRITEFGRGQILDGIGDLRRSFSTAVPSAAGVLGTASNPDGSVIRLSDLAVLPEGPCEDWHLAPDGDLVVVKATTKAPCKAGPTLLRSLSTREDRPIQIDETQAPLSVKPAGFSPRSTTVLLSWKPRNTVETLAVDTSSGKLRSPRSLGSGAVVGWLDDRRVLWAAEGVVAGPDAIGPSLQLWDVTTGQGHTVIAPAEPGAARTWCWSPHQPDVVLEEHVARGKPRPSDGSPVVRLVRLDGTVQTEAALPHPAADACGAYLGRDEPVFWSDNNGGSSLVWMADLAAGRIVLGPAEFRARSIISGPAGQAVALGEASTVHLARDGSSTELLSSASLHARDAQFAPAGDRIVLDVRAPDGTALAVIMTADGTVLESLPEIASAGWVRA